MASILRRSLDLGVVAVPHNLEPASGVVDAGGVYRRCCGANYELRRIRNVGSLCIVHDGPESRIIGQSQMGGSKELSSSGHRDADSVWTPPQEQRHIERSTAVPWKYASEISRGEWWDISLRP